MTKTIASFDDDLLELLVCNHQEVQLPEEGHYGFLLLCAFSAIH